MLSDVVFQRNLPEVVEQLLSFREIARPWIARAERERIGMVRRIDATTRVAVDIPGAAKLGVLLDDGIGNAEPAQRHAKRDGADAGADDQDMLAGQRFVRGWLAPARLARHE